MHKSLVILAAFVLGSAVVQGAPTKGGSWCNNPKNEPFWGAASAACCNGWMGDDRRCHDIRDCRAFYSCCISKYQSANHVTDGCN